MMYSYFDCRNFSQSRYCREKCISFCRFLENSSPGCKTAGHRYSRYLCWTPLVRSQMFSLLRVHSLSKWDQCGAAERITCGGIYELRICWLSDCFLVCIVACMPVCQLVSLIVWLLACLTVCLPACLLASLSACLSDGLLASLSACLTACLSDCLLV
jgi:hypothetical protein